jgi:DNA invertase Pin-like site-specific DNA recombinase
MNDLVELLARLIDRGIRVETISGELDAGDSTTARNVMLLSAFDKRARHGRTRSATASRDRPRRRSGDEVAEARQTIDAKRQPVAEVAHRLGVSRATLYRALRHR